MSYAEDLRAHYRAVHERLWGPAPKPIFWKPPPPPPAPEPEPVPEPEPEPEPIVLEPPPLPPELGPVTLDWRRITDVVSRYYGFHEVVLLAHGRQHDHSHARHMAWYLLHQEGLSYPVIGHLFNRNHSSVVKACQRIKRRLETTDVAAELVAIKEQLEHLREEAAHGAIEQAQG